jgi:hypothetical protein
MKSANDGQKLKLIDCIDKLDYKFKGTIFYSELKMMRLKYIYKDISYIELNKDVDYLRNIRQIARSK